MNIHKQGLFDKAGDDTAKPKKQRKGSKAEKPEKMSRKDYEKELEKLQVELCYL